MRVFFRALLLICVALFGMVESRAQSTISSPYSAYGLGLLMPQTFEASNAMGGVATALNLSDQINIVNPASYTSIGLSTLSIGGFMGVDRMRTSSSKQNDFNYGFTYFAAGMPVSPKTGIAFGILPYTSTGYNIGQRGNLIGDGGANVEYRNAAFGEGGYSKVFLGGGTKIAKGLSIGANFGYLFGNTHRDLVTEFKDPNAYNSNSNINTSASGFMFDYGIQYSFVTSSDVTWTLGHSGSLGNKVHLTDKETFYRYLYDSSGNRVGIDTLTSGGKKHQTNLPLLLNFGIAYHKQSKLLISADFQYQDWSLLELPSNYTNAAYKNGFSSKIGGQYTPDILGIKYWKRVEYRLGFNYTKTYLDVNGISINEYYTSLGVGLPLIVQYNAGRPYLRSKLNIALQMGARGTTDDGLIRERLTNLYMGLTFGNRWFIKRKFD